MVHRRRKSTKPTAVYGLVKELAHVDILFILTEIKDIGVGFRNVYGELR